MRGWSGAAATCRGSAGRRRARHLLGQPQPLPLSAPLHRLSQLAGREGTFALQDTGTVDGSIVSGGWFVVPGSGTGQLAGLRGDGGFRASLGEGAEVHLDYWFE